jgi:hypothetical protein
MGLDNTIAEMPKERVLGKLGLFNPMNLLSFQKTVSIRPGAFKSLVKLKRL